jgi:Fic family protein
MNDKIFTPKFDLTDSIRQGLEDVERNAWLVDRMLIMPKQEAWIRREVSVERAVGTTTIEGHEMTEAAVKELVKRGPSRASSEQERDNLNAIRAYEDIDYLSDQLDIPVSELVIRELNRTFIRGAAETLTPGIYRKGQNKVGLYSPPNQGDVPPLMRAFSQWLESDNQMHPVLKAGIAHIHFVAIHPFWDGNGRTARGLATLILQRSQFHFRKLLSLEKFMADSEAQYRDAIERTLGTEFSPSYDMTPWLEFFTYVVWAHSQQLSDKLTDWHRMIEEIYQVVEDMGVTHRQTEGLAFAYRMGRMTRADYMEITGVSPQTASRDLARLVETGALIAEGRTRSRVYLKPKTEPGQQEEARQLQLLEGREVKKES